MNNGATKPARASALIFIIISNGAADISFVANDVEASSAGMGPVGWGGHTVDEGIYLPTLADKLSM